MKKQRTRIPKEQLQEAMDRLEEVLVRDGHLLPMSAEEIPDGDLTLYGKGVAMDMDELKRLVEDRMSRRGHRATQPTQASESLAMAARNGDLISSSVLTRMRKDREKAEADARDGK